jgi:phage tail-like protein
VASLEFNQESEMTINATRGIPDELAAFRFWVAIDNQLVAVFKECSGLSGEIQVQSFEEGGNNDFEHKLPGRAKFGNVSLVTGLASAEVMWRWFADASIGNIRRRNVSVILHSIDRRGSLQWTLRAAYPVKWQGPKMTTDDNSIALQTLELAHHGIEFNKVSS